MSKVYMANCNARKAAGAVNGVSGGDHDPATLAACIGCNANVTVHYKFGDVYFEVPDYVPFLKECYPIVDQEFCKSLLTCTEHTIELKQAIAP